MKDWLALAKPRITAMVALAAAAGFALASPGGLDWPRLAWTALGVALASASTGCLNQVMEAEFDALMDRTKERPLAAGRVSRGAAHALGLLWGAAGLALLAWKVNGLSCGLTAFTLASYLLAYTPMKRFSPASLWVGAVPGAMPPLIGWAAAGAALDARAGALFAVQFFWQLPHFIALSRLYREDYERGGFRVMIAGRLGWSSAALLAASALPYWTGLAGASYAVPAAALGLVMLFLRADAKRVFLASLVYLPAVYGLLLAAR